MSCVPVYVLTWISWPKLHSPPGRDHIIEYSLLPGVCRFSGRTLAVSRTNSRSEARAEAVGVGSSALLGFLRRFAAVQPEGTAQSFRVASAPNLGAVPWKAGKQFQNLTARRNRYSPTQSILYNVSNSPPLYRRRSHISQNNSYAPPLHYSMSNDILRCRIVHTFLHDPKDVRSSPIWRNHSAYRHGKIGNPCE